MFPQVKRDLPQDTPWVFLNKSLPLMKTKPLSKTFEWPLVTFLQKSIALTKLVLKWQTPKPILTSSWKKWGSFKPKLTQQTPGI